MGRVIDIEDRITDLEEELGKGVVFWERQDFEDVLRISPDQRVRNNVSVYYMMVLEQLKQNNDDRNNPQNMGK